MCRGYTKSSTEYRSNEINKIRSKRRRLSAAPIAELPESNLDSDLNIENLSVLEIKEKLKELGVQT